MKKNILRLFLFLSSCAFILVVQTNASGPGSGYTNAPSESNCTGSSCHNGSLVTSGTKHDKIKIIHSFTGNGYIPDSTYTLYFTYKESSKSKWGFQMTALDAKSNSPAGSFTSPDSRSQTYSYTVSSKTRSSIGHSNAGTSSVSTDSVAWKITWKAPNSNVGNIIFYAVLNVADGNGQSSNDVIYAKQFTFSPSNLLPVAKAKVIDTNLCTNLQMTFDPSGSTGSPTSYTWNFPSGSPNSSTAQNPKVTYFAAGTYKAILTVKNAKGVSAPDTITYTVKTGASLPIITPGGVSNICAGDSLQLSSSNLAGHTYLWSPQGQTTRVIKVADSGAYTVTAISANKCTRTSAAAMVKVNPLPAVNIIKSFSGDTICAGTPFSMGSLVTSGPADSFSFVSKSGPFTKSDTIVRSLSSGPVTYTLWAKNTKGCVSKGSSAVVQVKAAVAGPVLTASNISFTSFKVNWAAVGGATGYRVSIDSGKTFITPSSGNSGLEHDVTGLIGNHTMKVQVYALINDLCGKSETAEIQVTTLSCTPLSFTLDVADNRNCLNKSVPVVLHNLAGKKIGVMVDGVFKGNDTIVDVVITGTKDYSISVIDSGSVICGYTTLTTKLIEDTIATPVTNFFGNRAYCSNTGTASATISASALPAFDSFVFIQNGAEVARKKSNSHVFTVKTGDSVWVVAQNANGCQSMPSAKTYTTVNLFPGDAGFSITNTQFDYTFTANDGTGTHMWYWGSDSADGSAPLVDLTASKDDSVLITHVITKNGCSSTSSKKIFVPDFAGVDIKTIPGARIYPNPAADRLYVELPKINGTATIRIYNTNGQLVQTAVLKTGNNEIVTEMLSPGTYSFRVQAENKETTGSIIIER